MSDTSRKLKVDSLRRRVLRRGWRQRGFHDRDINHFVKQEIARRNLVAARKADPFVDYLVTAMMEQLDKAVDEALITGSIDVETRGLYSDDEILLD